MKMFILMLSLFISLTTPVYAEPAVTGGNNVVEFNNETSGRKEEGSSRNKKKVKKSNFTDTILNGISTTEVEVPREFIEPVNRTSALMVEVFLSTMVGVIVVFTVIDMVAILISPLRGLLGSESSGEMGGGGGRSKITWVTSDFKNAIAACEGGGMGGGEGGGAKNVWVEYGKLRLKTAVFGVVFSTILLTPPLFELIVVGVDALIMLFTNMLGSVR